MLAKFCLAMASVNVCRLCTNVDKTINLFSRAGMRNECSLQPPEVRLVVLVGEAGYAFPT